jgi:phosphate transport system protein
MLHFREELEELQSKLLEMGGLVEAAIHNSVYALVERDEDRAKEVMWNEAQVNQREMEIDELATRMLALFQPMARDLRLITAVIKMNSDLERMGDLAVNITERALSLMKEPSVRPPIDIPRIAELAESMVHRALDAFARGDADMARDVLLADDDVDNLRDSVYQELIEFMQEERTTINLAIDLLFIVQHLERIADHATNIAEDVLFLVKGVDVRHHAEAREAS